MGGTPHYPGEEQAKKLNISFGNNAESGRDAALTYVESNQQPQKLDRDWHQKKEHEARDRYRPEK